MHTATFLQHLLNKTVFILYEHVFILYQTKENSWKRICGHPPLTLLGVNIQENFEKSGKVPGTPRVPKQPFYVPASP